MNAHSEWVLRMSWLVPLLNLWLKVPKTGLALTFIMLLSLLVGGYHLSAWLHYTASSPTLPASSTTAFNLAQAPANQSAARASRLPDLTSFALYELAQPLGSPEISQQGDRFTLDFAANWSSFAEFINQIAQTSFAPESYRMQWESSLIADLAVQLDLVPGGYLTHNKQAISLPPASQSNAPQVENTMNLAPPACTSPPPPKFILQASWPSRGYIQVHSEGRVERISVNQMLQNSWKLLRIGSDSLEFRWQAPNPACNNPAPVTVAI